METGDVMDVRANGAWGTDRLLGSTHIRQKHQNGVSLWIWTFSALPWRFQQKVPEQSSPCQTPVCSSGQKDVFIFYPSQLTSVLDAPFLQDVEQFRLKRTSVLASRFLHMRNSSGAGDFYRQLFSFSDSLIFLHNPSMLLLFLLL